MKFVIYITLLFWGLTLSACAQSPSSQNQQPLPQSKIDTMNLEKITNPIVKQAVEALQKGDKTAWFTLFSENAELYDDGRKMDFRSFFEKALGHEHFTSIDIVENDGKDIFGQFHTEQWGDFKTYFKFQLNTDREINRLDIGQASY